MNTKNPLELPVLMIAVNKGLTDIVKFLLEVGPDPNIPDMVMSFMTIFVLDVYLLGIW